MRRIAFNLIAIASMLLCVATIASWVRSYFRCDQFGYQTQVDKRDQQWLIGLSWSRGVVAYDHNFIVDLNRPMAELYGFQLIDSIDPRPFTIARFAGFGYQHQKQFAAPCTWWRSVLYVPHWALAFLFAWPPAGWLMHWRRRRAHRGRGFRVISGYDLRATPDRCPECGTPAHARAAVSCDDADALRIPVRIRANSLNPLALAARCFIPIM